MLGAIDRGWWPVGLLILASSLIAVIYIWRVVETAYFKPAPENEKDIDEAPAAMLLPTWILIGASIYFGIDTSLTVSVAEQATTTLIGGVN